MNNTSSIIDGQKIRLGELAQALGVSKGTVSEWAKNGKLPAPMRLGSLVFWMRADIEKFLEESRG